MNNRQKYINNVMNGKTKFAQKQKLKMLDEKVHGVTPQIFASFALTLSYDHYGWTSEQIEELFVEVMNLWDDCAEMGLNMCEWCEEVTGIDVEEKR